MNEKDERKHTTNEEMAHRVSRKISAQNTGAKLRFQGIKSKAIKNKMK